MNKPSEPHKTKGISVEGFWRQLKDKQAKKDIGPNAINFRDVSEANVSEANVEFLELPDPKDNWEARFDAWLDRP